MANDVRSRSHSGQRTPTTVEILKNEKKTSNALA